MTTQELFDKTSMILGRPIDVRVNHEGTVIILKNSVYGLEIEELKKEFGNDVWYSDVFNGLVIG